MNIERIEIALVADPNRRVIVRAFDEQGNKLADEHEWTLDLVLTRFWRNNPELRDHYDLLNMLKY